MTHRHLARTMRQFYALTAFFGLIGFVSYFCLQGARPAFGFLLGSLGSLGNLWLFGWLAHSISPGATTPRRWQPALFIARYLVLFTVGYVIVNALGVSPLAVILGLLASTAAILAVGVIEIFQNFLWKRRAED